MAPPNLDHVVVVGGSLAGLRALEALRHDGYRGQLTLIGAESHEPYDRPPLSKDFLAGAADAASLALRKQGYDDLDVTLALGAPAHSLDVDARTVGVGDDTLRFDGMVIATGAHPRPLPDQPDLAGVHTLRTVEDSDALSERLEAGARMCVIGAGFIGAEVAATARGRGRDVTVLEALPQPMVRGVGPVIGAVLASLHRDHGVDLRVGVGVESITGGAHVERVQLADGTAVECEAVLVAIGAVPTTDWLEGSGLALDNGVVCDAALRAAPGIVAAGDLCRWPNAAFDDEVMRIEHWTNATEQGTHAARSLLAGGDAEPFVAVPFVWSDQYDVKIQSVGRFSGDDRMEIVHGSPDDYKFTAIFERNGRVSGALGFNMARRVIQYRRMIAERATFDAALAFAAANP